MRSAADPRRAAHLHHGGGRSRQRDHDVPHRLDGQGARRPSPQQRPSWWGNRSLIPGAIEELLRFETPAPHMARVTSREVELHGRNGPRGKHRPMIPASANHDDRRFPEGDRFDVHRRDGQPLTFGFGIHLCLGRPSPGSRVRWPSTRSSSVSRDGRWTGTGPNSPSASTCSRLGDPSGGDPMSGSPPPPRIDVTDLSGGW